MARPTPTTAFQEELYSSLGPVADQDSANNWALLKYCGAIASMFDQIETIARDTAAGAPGWSNLLDPDNCPPELLAFLGQFVGVLPDKTLSVAAQRSSVKSLASFNRGTPAALKAAAAQYLSGTKSVFVSERYGSDAYQMYVATYASETADSAKVLAAILSQKPAGIVLTYVVSAGYTYDIVKGEFNNYTALKAGYATYGGMTAHIPGT